MTRGWPQTALRSVTAGLITALALAGCASNDARPSAVRYAETATAPLPATTPYLVMTDADTGWAIWPSGDEWTLLATRDGWRTIDNATPVAVPTGGGLVVAEAGRRLAVAIGRYERLLRSPVLTSSDTTIKWRPDELPGAVTDDRDALSLADGQLTAVDQGAGGAVVTAGRHGWTTLVTARDLDPEGNLHLDTVTWASRSLGWLTGHGPTGTPVAFQTDDAGRDWTPVPLHQPTAVAALAPCGSGTHWLLPVVTPGRITVQRTADGGRSWHAGQSLALATGAPAWGCRGSQVLLAARSDGTDRVFASDDAGSSWSARGTAPAGLSALAPAAGGAGFAVSGSAKAPKLWAVTGDGAHFEARPLPGWVARLGGSSSTT